MPSHASVRRLGALFAAGVGLMNILSALFPAIPSRMEILRDLLPMHLIRASQTATVLIGFCLILLADGLRKRRRRAMQVTVALLVASTVLHLSKGLDFEEATVSSLLALGLVVGHASFDIPSRVPAPRHIAQQVLTLCLLYYCFVLAGFLVLRRVISPAPSLWSATLEPVRLLMDTPHFQYLTPQAGWFARSIVLVASIGAMYAVVQLLRPFIPLPPHTESELGQVHALVRRYGTDTLSYFALQDGRSYFFDETGEAFLSYRLWGTVALVGGDPVGRADRIAPLIASFLDFARANGIDACFLGVAGTHAQAYRASGLRLLKIGEEALIDLCSFSEPGLKRKVRRAARHVRELGIEARRYRAAEVPAEIREQLEVISRQWVGAKGGCEQGFSMTLGRLPRPTDEECELIVAEENGHVWGYLSFVPACDGLVWSLDAMRRRPESPNGLVEFLVVSAARMYGEQGCRELSLNFATLSNSENDIDSRALDGARNFLWEHLSSVYQLKSLYQFNSKFQPVWRSRYLAYGDVLKIPKLALAIAQSEAPIQLASPIALSRREQT